MTLKTPLDTPVAAQGDFDAAVVGSGPNGLAAALTLSEAGLKVVVVEQADTIGGGTRTKELTVPGVLHDVCSAVHPLGISSPYFNTLNLQEHGLTWKQPPIPLAHPLPNGDIGVLHQSLSETAARMGSDSGTWKRTFSHTVNNFDAITQDTLKPLTSPPKHPLIMSRFGTHAARSSTGFVKRFRHESTRALFGGVAAHLMGNLNLPFSASIGVMLTAAAHHKGWPVAQGGSQAITDALASKLKQTGGVIITGTKITHIQQLAGIPVIMLDTSPQAAAKLLTYRQTARQAKRYRTWKNGPAAYKIDLAVKEHIPWKNPECHQAGVIHLGGTFNEIVESENTVVSGTLPHQPFTLVAQQHVADPTRSNGDIHPIWVYAHVPNGHTGNITEQIIDHIEQYAPNMRKHIIQTVATGPVALQQYNPNYVGGDIATGANTPKQLIAKPKLFNPYNTGVQGVYLCSAATPPGAGVHGMCGHNAAKQALKEFYGP